MGKATAHPALEPAGMSIRNLDSLFRPASVAVIGASQRPGSPGATAWNNVLKAGFGGAIHAVNPKYRELSGHACHADVGRLPQAPELALICTPAATVAPIVERLARLGTRAAVILSGALDHRQRRAALRAARPALMRLLGPGSVGLLAPHAGLNASVAPSAARPGQVALVSQSGALATALLDWATARGIGFSQFVSLGDSMDVDAADLLDDLASDAHTRAILLHITSITQAGKFMSAARAAARNKPVIVVHAGRSAAGQRALAARRRSRGSTTAVADAALARAGLLRVDTLEELFTAAEILTRFQPPVGKQVTLLGNGSGLGLLAADAAAVHGVPLAELPAELLQELDPLLPAHGARGNPLDLGSHAPVQRHVRVVRALARHRDAVGTLVYLYAPTASAPAAQLADALLPELRPAGQPPLPVVSAWVGGPAVADARARFSAAGIACHAQPEQAVAAIAMLQAYARNQEELTEAPGTAFRAGPDAPDRQAVRQIIDAALAAQAQWLDASDAQRVCAAYGLALQVAAHEQRAQALWAGTRIDPVFGPVILLGQGHAPDNLDGKHVVALPPLNDTLARALLARARRAGILPDTHGLPAAALDALADTLQAVSNMLADIPELAQLDLHPLRIDVTGAMAPGARLRISAERPAGASRFAIAPYPAHLIETRSWRDGELTLRPIRPEDEAQHLDFLRSLDADDIRMRVFHSRRSLPRSELARMVQVDYRREMAFVATTTDESGRERTLGVVRASADPDNVEAEFSIILRPGLKGGGLGRMLMDKLIAYQRSAGTQRLMAFALSENMRMRGLARALGFSDKAVPDDPGVHYLELALN